MNNPEPVSESQVKGNPMKKLLLLIVATAVSFLLLELVAGWIWKSKYNSWMEKELHGYEYVDRDNSVIKHVPGRKMYFKEYRNLLVELNKSLAVSELENQYPMFPDSFMIFQIDSLGFKSPEISLRKPDSTFRILTIGNSCTWGPPVDSFSYPRTMERSLRARVKSGKIEVVNAAVKGYNFDRVLKRLEEFMAVDPDLVTIYLGWNHTIGRADPRKSEFLYNHLALYRIYYHFIVNRTDTGLDSDFAKKTFFNAQDRAMAAFQDYDFTYDLEDLEDIIDIIRNKYHCPVAIITLAGLLDYRVQPDSAALAMAYPIASTNNLYAYVLLTKKFNDSLRLIARKHNLLMFDLEAFSIPVMVPRSSYYIDSVHPSLKGYQVIGKYLADEISHAYPGTFQ